MIKKILITLICAVIILPSLTAPVAAKGSKISICANLGRFEPLEWNSSTQWWSQVADTWASIPYRFYVENARVEKHVVGIWYRVIGASSGTIVKQKMELDCTYEGAILISGLCPNKGYEYFFFTYKKGDKEETAFPADFPANKYLKKFKTKLPRINVANKAIQFLTKDRYTIQADCYNFMNRKNCYVELFICALCDNQGAIGPKDAGTRYWEATGTADKRYGPGTEITDEIQYFRVIEADRKFDHYYRFVFTYPDSGRWITQQTDWTRFQIVKK